MRYAVVFPGQGIIKPNILKPLLKYPITPTLDIINNAMGYNFTDQMLSNNDAWFKKTSNAQPTIVSINYLMQQICKDFYGIDVIGKAELLMGHSLGEYTSLCLSGILDLSTTLKLVHLRGKLMESLPWDHYGMKALLFRPSEFTTVYNQCNHHDVLANINNHQQIVISGRHHDLHQVIHDLNQSKRVVTAKNLPVEIPFHNSILSSIESDLWQSIAKHDIHQVNIPMISNLYGDILNDPTEIIKFTIAGNSKPVNWVNAMEMIKSKYNITNIINFGPSDVLYRINAKFDVNNYLVDELSPKEIDDIRHLINGNV